MSSNDLPPLRILVAESAPDEIEHIRSNIDREFQAGIQIVNNYYDLLKKVTEPAQQLLILGTVDRSNQLGTCQECHKISEQLPIVRIWVRVFMEECERIIVDFGTILDNSNLSPLAKDPISKS